MRTLLTGTMVVGALLTGVIATRVVAEPCALPIERTAFDITGLKSELMVTALSCNAQDKYNSFIFKYRSDLIKHERALNGYFNRSFGRRGQKEHDDYITQLANVQSESGLKLGNTFCQQNVGLFDRVLALPNGAALPDFAAGQSLVQPVSLETCVTRKPTTRMATAHPGQNHN